MVPTLFILLHYLQVINSLNSLNLLRKIAIMSDHELEKPGGVEHAQRTISEDTNDAFIAEFSEAEQKAITRRIDYRLVVTLGVLYCASLMDRTNLGSAAIAGSVTLPHPYTNLMRTQTEWSSI